MELYAVCKIDKWQFLEQFTASRAKSIDTLWKFNYPQGCVLLEMQTVKW